MVRIAERVAAKWAISGIVRMGFWRARRLPKMAVKDGQLEPSHGRQSANLAKPALAYFAAVSWVYDKASWTCCTLPQHLAGTLPKPLTINGPDRDLTRARYSVSSPSANFSWWLIQTVIGNRPLLRC